MSNRDVIKTYGIPLFLIFVTVLVYSNSFSAEWHLDDLRTIKDYDYVNATLHSLFKFSPQRSLSMVTFWLNHQVHGYSLWGWHAVNLMIHCVNVLLVYWLIAFLFLDSRSSFHPSDQKFATGAATIGALFFALQPVQVHAVTYVVQRMEILGTTWVLLMTIAAIKVFAAEKVSARIGWGIIAVLAGIAGGLTKEIIAAAPVLAGAYIVLIRVRSWKARLAIMCVCGAVAFIGILGALTFFKAIAWTPVPRFSSAPFTVLFRDYLPAELYYPTQVRVIAFLLRMCIIPAGMAVEYVFVPGSSWLDSRVLLAGCIQIGVVIVALLLWRRRPFVLFGIVWFYVLIAPSSVLPNGIFLHRVYGALTGVIIAVCIPIAKEIQNKPARIRSSAATAGIIAGMLISTIFALQSYNRNEVWATETSLWKEGVERAPTNWRAHANYGWALLQEGKVQQAGPYLMESYEMKSNVWMVANNLGLYYFQAGLPDKSLEMFEKALSLKPKLKMLQENTGTLHIFVGNITQGTNLLVRAGTADAYVTAGNYFEVKTDYEEAEKYYRKAYRKQPENVDIQTRLLRILKARNATQEIQRLKREISDKATSTGKANE